MRQNYQIYQKNHHDLVKVNLSFSKASAMSRYRHLRKTYSLRKTLAKPVFFRLNRCITRGKHKNIYKESSTGKETMFQDPSGWPIAWLAG